MTVSIKVGDRLPATPVRQPLGGDIPPVWLALTVPPRRDFACVDYMQRHGLKAFAPSIQRVRHLRGVRSEVTLPVVPGIVYARFDRAPHWDVLRARRIVSGVLARGGMPIVLRADDLSRLRGLPDAVRAMVERAETVSAGDVVRLSRGPLAGYLVEVTQVRGAQALCDVMGVRVTMRVADLVADA